MTHRSRVPIGLLALALLGGACRPAPTSLEELPTVAVPLPTPTATPPPAPTPTPTPEGWQLKRDPVTGRPFLAPPPAEREAILAAFRAVLGCIYLIVPDPEEVTRWPRERLLALRDQALQAAQAVTLKPFYEYCNAIFTGLNLNHWNGLLGITPESAWGPEQIQCDTHTACEVTRLKTGKTRFYINYEEALETFSDPLLHEYAAHNPPPFIVSAEDIHPFEIYKARIIYRDNAWKVEAFQVIALPPTPTPAP